MFQNNVLLVVLYKETLASSTTIHSFLKSRKYHKKIKLIIWDNSPNKIEDFSLLNDYNLSFKYIWTPENLPLSVIYNQVIENIINADFLFLFDQDSSFNDVYFDEFFCSLNDNLDLKLFLPLIKNQNRIVSPGLFWIYKGVYIRENIGGRISSKNILAVSSGMIIRINIFRESPLKFDENLSLYGIDSKFLLDYSEFYKELFVLNYELKHNLSQFIVESKDVKLQRMKKYMGSWLYILKNKTPFGYAIACFVWSIKFLLFYISPSFLKDKV